MNLGSLNSSLSHGHEIIIPASIFPLLLFLSLKWLSCFPCLPKSYPFFAAQLKFYFLKEDCLDNVIITSPFFFSSIMYVSYGWPSTIQHLIVHHPECFCTTSYGLNLFILENTFLKSSNHVLYFLIVFSRVLSKESSLQQTMCCSTPIFSSKPNH